MTLQVNVHFSGTNNIAQYTFLGVEFDIHLKTLVGETLLTFREREWEAKLNSGKTLKKKLLKKYNKLHFFSWSKTAGWYPPFKRTLQTNGRHGSLVYHKRRQGALETRLGTTFLTRGHKLRRHGSVSRPRNQRP